MTVHLENPGCSLRKRSLSAKAIHTVERRKATGLLYSLIYNLRPITLMVSPINRPAIIKEGM